MQNKGTDKAGSDRQMRQTDKWEADPLNTGGVVISRDARTRSVLDFELFQILECLQAANDYCGDESPDKNESGVFSCLVSSLTVNLDSILVFSHYG